MPKLTQDFNIYPYFDDFKEENKFLKILFRPGYSIQARELTQLQSLLQNQIEKVGSSIYRNGSKVFGCDLTLNTKIKSLKVKVNYLGQEINVLNFIGKTIVGQTSGARAEVITATEFTTKDQNTLFINYTDDTLFLDDEVISTPDEEIVYFANAAGVDQGLNGSIELSTSLSTGDGSIISVDEGVFYVGGYFVYVEPQTIVLDKYKKNPTYRIGLSINEEIVSSIEDDQLLDNAIGSPNHTAPGANRYKVYLSLEKKNNFEKGATIIPDGATFSVNPDGKSGVVNITTASDHLLKVGDTIVVTDSDSPEYNGKFSIATVPSTTQFSYIINGKPPIVSSGPIQYVKGIVDPIEKNSSQNFIELLRIENGQVVEEVKYPIIGDIEKTMARRTYEQSGDFTVKPFSLDIQNHRTVGYSTNRSATSTSQIIVGEGTNIIRDFNLGDEMFLSGNINKTAIISTLANTTAFSISSPTTLGDGSPRQKIGNSKKLSACVGPGKAYVKGFEFETVSTTYLDVNKARDFRTVVNESQGVDFGPYFRITDVWSNTTFDTGVNTSAGSAKGSGMDLIDLHIVKWPSTTRTDATLATENILIHDSNSDIKFVAIDTTNENTISNTKIGTARLRQIDYYSFRDDAVNDVYTTNISNPSTARTMHRTFPTVYDAHVFDFDFENYTGDVLAGNSNTLLVHLDGSKFPTVNSLYGSTITINTTALGISTSDTRRIVKYTGANTVLDPGTSYTAVLDQPLTQPTTTSSSFSVSFGIKDVKSGIKTSSDGTTIEAGFNVDLSGKTNTSDIGDTILFGNNDDQRSLVFPIQNKAVKDISGNVKYKMKRTFVKNLVANSAQITAPAGEKFYPGVDGLMSELDSSQNYIVSVVGEDGDQQEGDYLEFTSLSSTGMSSGRTMSISSDGEILTINLDTDGGSSSLSPNYLNKTLHIVATTIVDDANFTQGSLGKKVLVSANTTVCGVNTLEKYVTSNTTQALLGQISFSTDIDVRPGAPNSLRISDVAEVVAIVDSLDPTKNVSNTMMVSAIASAIGETPSVFDITSNFSFDDGQRDNFYDYSTITLKPGKPAPIGQVLAVVNYYKHEGYGPFTVKSYNYLGSGNTKYELIPSYTSSITGQKFELRDVIDFRPKRIGIDTVDTVLGESFTNDKKTTSNVFHEKALPDYDFSLDVGYDHYLPRKDKIAIGRDKSFRIIEGISDLNPVLPPDDEDALTLYSLELPAYTFNPKDVKTRYIENKRYTMRDIGKLEKRIENLEYYVSLSLLEKEADGLVITDSNNNDRFKNGILVDPCAGHNIGDVFNGDYASSIDYDNKHLRPTFTSDAYNFDYRYKKTTDEVNPSTLVNNGGVLTLPFSSNNFVSQPFTGGISQAGINSKNTVKINPFSIQNYIGQLQMNPFSDIWYDQTSIVDVKVNIEGQYDNWIHSPLNNGHGTHYNDWEELWSGKQINNDIKEGIRDVGDFADNDRRAKTTNQQKTLTGIKSGNIPEKIVQTFGNKVINLSVVPRVREQYVNFVAKGLKPGKNVYAFFGDFAVTHKVKQASLITLSEVNSSNVFETTSGNYEKIRIIGSGDSAGNTATVLYMSDRNSINSCSIMITDISNEQAFGEGVTIIGERSSVTGNIEAVRHYEYVDGELIVNSEGVTAGKFHIEPNKYFGSENLFRLCDDPSNIPAVTTSVAEDIFYSRCALNLDNEFGILSHRPLIIKREDMTQERVSRVSFDAKGSQSSEFLNPMAQTFIVDKNQYPEGIFADKVTLYFNHKDLSVSAKKSVILQLRPVINGIPSASTVIPGTEVVLTPARITANTSIPTPNINGEFPETPLGNSYTANRNNLDIGSQTIFKFDHPVYLPPNEYAIVVQTNSSIYDLYAYQLGASHTGTTSTISKQPYVGSFFKPNNLGNWIPQEDFGLMFNVNRCEFSQKSGYARLDNKPNSLSLTNSNTVFDTIKFVTDVQNFTQTLSQFRYYSTNKSSSVKESAELFTINKNLDLNSQKQITYTSDTGNPQYANSMQINVYFETTNTLISPFLNSTRFGVICVENIINNGSISNSDIIITNRGSGYDDDLLSNTSVFVVSSPDIGSNVATLTANAYANGIINKVVVQNGGAGYLTNPTVTIYDGGNDYVAGDGAVIKISGEGAKGSEMLTANVEHSTGGNYSARYITRRVTLEENFDARDLKVYINAYKPRGSEIYVFYKVLATEDSEPFDEKPYILMTQETANSTYSLNENDFKSFAYKTKDQYISYKNSTGTQFNNFRTFAIKIVFALNRVAQDTFIGIPRISDIRAVALDSEGQP